MVELFGLPADTKRKNKTKLAHNTFMNTIFNDEIFSFNKVIIFLSIFLKTAAEISSSSWFFISFLWCISLQCFLFWLHYDQIAWKALNSCRRRVQNFLFVVAVQSAEIKVGFGWFFKSFLTELSNITVSLKIYD